MSLADCITYSLLLGAALALVAIIWNYAKGLRACPRDLWLLFGYKFVEYSAYAAMNMSISLWLSKDCKLGDVGAGGMAVLSLIGLLLFRNWFLRNTAHHDGV